LPLLVEESPPEVPVSVPEAVSDVSEVGSVGFPHEESKKAPRTRVRKILLSGLLVRM
jgi:hypothetical protein